ncbi:MAG: hypothetical protein JWN78_2692 [Bacteroidota bacterium]|nr:hypothetical protein [Bacteroidota bacterium]
MKNIRYQITLLISMLSLAAWAQRIDTVATRVYIQQYKDVAIEEMNRSGIPASITLAQGIHESGLGKSYLAINTNNHFGIKCHENWTGKTFKYTDDSPDECFRVYDKAEDSYKDHTNFLVNRPRYAQLFELDKTDYKSWAYGLKKAGYATNPKYPDILIKTIEDFQLNLFDNGGQPAYVNAVTQPVIAGKQEDLDFMDMDSISTDAPQDVEKKSEVTPDVEIETVVPGSLPVGEQKIIKINRRKAVQVGQNETLALIGGILNISKQDLLFYNDITDENMIKPGQPLFIQQKKDRNREGDYIVQEGDNMWGISQKKGIRLAALLKHNRMVSGEEAAVNENLYLKGTVAVKPKLRPVNVLKKEVEAAPVAAVDAPFAVRPPAEEPLKTITTSPEESVVQNTPVQQTPSEDLKQDSEKNKTITDVEMTASVNNTPQSSPVVQTEEKTIYPSVIDYGKLPKSTNAFHTVIKGDTMYNISKRYNISLSQIMEWNNLSDQNIKLGQVLKIQP